VALVAFVALVRRRVGLASSGASAGVASDVSAAAGSVLARRVVVVRLRRVGV